MEATPRHAANVPRGLSTRNAYTLPMPPIETTGPGRDTSAGVMGGASMNLTRTRKATVTNSLDPSNIRAYRRRARPVLFLGVMLVLVGLRGYIVPASADDTAAHMVLGNIAYGVWHLGLTLSGVLLILGLWPRVMPEIEVVGLWAAMWAVVVHCGALVMVFGGRAASTLALALTLLWVLWGRIDDLRMLALSDRRGHDPRPQGPRERATDEP